MDRYRNLFKQNALTTTRSRKNNVQEFLRGRRNRRSEVMDVQRQIEPEDLVVPLSEEKLPTSASKKQQRPFVVGKVRHKAHSPPFLHQPVNSEDKRKITPLKSFAPVNYQFRKRFLINSPSPSKSENRRSPFSKKTSNSKKKNLKSAKHDADHVTVRAYTKPTPADLQSNNSLNTPVFGRENCEDIHGNARKQLWPDPSEEVIFGRSNVARALKLKDSTPRSPQGTFEMYPRPVYSPPEKENIISSSLMFHKNLEKIVQNMDSDCSEDFDTSEHHGDQKSQSLTRDEDIMIPARDASSNNHQAYESDNHDIINQSARITTRSSYRLSRNRSRHEEKSLKSSELSREDAVSGDKSLQDSISNNINDIHYSIGQSFSHDENNGSASLNSIEADIFNKALTDSLESSVCNEGKSEEDIAEVSSEKCEVPQDREQKSSSNLSSPISLECREEMRDTSSSTDHSHQSLDNKNSKNENEKLSIERTDLLFLGSATSLDCTEKQTGDAFEKYGKAMGNAYEVLSDVSSPTLLVRNLADLDESLTMQIFPQMKIRFEEPSKSSLTNDGDCNVIVDRKDSLSVSPNRFSEGSANNLLGDEEIAPAQILPSGNKSSAPEIVEESNTNGSPPSSPTTVSTGRNSPLLSSSLMSTNLKRMSKSSSSEEYASSEKSEEVADAQISGDASKISSRSINEIDCNEGTSERRGRISQNYYGVSRISVYIDSHPSEKRRSTTVEKKREPCQRLTQDSDLSIPSQLFLEKSDDSIQNKTVSSFEGKGVSRESARGSPLATLFMSPSYDAQTQASTKFDELDDTKSMDSENDNESVESIADAAKSYPKHPERNTFSCKEATPKKAHRACYSNGSKPSSAIADRELQNKHELSKPRKSARLSHATSEESEDVSLRESFFQSRKSARASREMKEDVSIPKNISITRGSSSQGDEISSEISSEDEMVENSLTSLDRSSLGQENEARVFKIHENSHDYSRDTDLIDISITQSEKGDPKPVSSKSTEVISEKDLKAMDELASRVSSSSQRQSSRSSISEIRSSGGGDRNKSSNESRDESSYHLVELMASRELEESLKNISQVQSVNEDPSFSVRKSVVVADAPFEVKIGEEIEGGETPDEILSNNSARLSKSRGSVKEKSFSNTDPSCRLQNEILGNSQIEVRRSNSIGTQEMYELSTSSRAAEEILNVTKRRSRSAIKVLNDSVDKVKTKMPFDQQDAEIPEDLVAEKNHEEFDENPVVEKERTTDATKTPRDLGKVDSQVKKLRDLDMNKENVEPNFMTPQNSPYKLRVRTPRNQMSPAVVLAVSTPLMSQDTATKEEKNSGLVEEASNASPKITQEKKRYLEVVKNMNPDASKDEVNSQTSPYSLRIRTPKSQKKEAPSRARTPLKSRENVKKSPETKEPHVESEVESMLEKVESVSTEKNTRRKGRLVKNASENEVSVENSPHKSKARTPRNQKTAVVAESDVLTEPREQFKLNSETKDPEIEPVAENQKSRRRRAAKANSKNVVQDELGIENSPYKLRERTPKNKKDGALTLKLTPMKSPNEPGQNVETKQNQNGEVPKTPNETAVENRAGKKRGKVVKPQDGMDQKAELEANQGEEIPKTPNEPDENHEGQKRRRGARNVSKNPEAEGANVQESPYKLRDKTPRTQKKKLAPGTPSKSQERVEHHPQLEVEATKETFQTPNEPGMKSHEKKRGRKGVKNPSEVLAVDDVSEEGSRYKLRSRTPKGQANVVPEETKKSSTKKTSRQKKTRTAVARALPMDLPGVVIDFENPPAVGGTNANSPPSTPKSPIIVPFRKENTKVSDKPQEIEALDLSSDDDELDYRVFLSRVVAKRGLNVTLSPMTPSLNARQAKRDMSRISPSVPKTPAIKPGLCITSETPRTPVTVLAAPIEESPISSMASPLRVLSLRNRGISVSPSPKKSTPRKQV